MIHLLRITPCCWRILLVWVNPSELAIVHIFWSPQYATENKIFSKSTESCTAPLCPRIPIHHLPAKLRMQVTGIWAKANFPTSLFSIPWGLSSDSDGSRRFYCVGFQQHIFSPRVRAQMFTFHFRLTLERTAVWSAPHETNTVFQCSSAFIYDGQPLSGKKTVLLKWKRTVESHTNKDLENRFLALFSPLLQQLMYLHLGFELLPTLDSNIFFLIMFCLFHRVFF